MRSNIILRSISIWSSLLLVSTSRHQQSINIFASMVNYRNWNRSHMQDIFLYRTKCHPSIVCRRSTYYRHRRCCCELKKVAKNSAKCTFTTHSSQLSCTELVFWILLLFFNSRFLLFVHAVSISLSLTYGSTSALHNNNDENYFLITRDERKKNDQQAEANE